MGLQGPERRRPRLFFQRVPEPTTVKNRVHLDLRVGTGLTGDERVAALETEAARLEQHGATRVRLMPADGFDEACLVMQDVEGNEFPPRLRVSRWRQPAPGRGRR